MTEMDRPDPPPRAPRRPRRRKPAKGSTEEAVLTDLAKLPADLQTSAVAVSAALLARQLDEGGTVPRDIAGHVRKLARLLADDEMTAEMAATALQVVARHIEDGMSPRDSAGHVRELRMCMTQLREWNPSGTKAGDDTDEARGNVEHARGLYAVGDQ